VRQVGYYQEFVTRCTVNKIQNFIFSYASKLLCGSCSLLFDGYPGDFSGGKMPREWNWQLTLSKTKTRNKWNCTFTPSYAFISWTRTTLPLHEGRWPVLDHCRIHHVQCVINHFFCTFMLEIANKKIILKNDTFSCNQLLHK